MLASMRLESSSLETTIRRAVKKTLKPMSNYGSWPINEDGPIQAGKDHYRCTWASRNHPRRSRAAPQLAGPNCNRLRLSFHLRVLVFALPLLRHDLTKSIPTPHWRSKSFSAGPLELRGWILFLINMLAIYGKSLPAGPYKVSSVDLAINLKSSIAPLAPDDKIYLPTSTCHCRGRTPPGRGGCTKSTNMMYKNATQTHFSKKFSS